MVEKKKWNAAVIENATLVTEGQGLMKTYDLKNGHMIKVLKEIKEAPFLYLLCHDPFVEELESKIEYANKIRVPDLVLPDSAYYTDEGIKAYTVPKVSGISLCHVVPKIKELRLYGDIFSKLSKRVKLMNQEGIILPDLGNFDNIFYDPKNDKFRFIDYDGIQVFDSMSFSCSTLLPAYGPPITNGKYGSFIDLWTHNVDILSLVLAFFAYSTKTDITDILYDISLERQSSKIENEDFEKLFSQLHIDDEQMRILITTLYDEKKDNIYPAEIFEEFSSTHKLVKKPNGGYFQRQKE